MEIAFSECKRIFQRLSKKTRLLTHARVGVCTIRCTTGYISLQLYLRRHSDIKTSNSFFSFFFLSSSSSLFNGTPCARMYGLISRNPVYPARIYTQASKVLQRLQRARFRFILCFFFFTLSLFFHPKPFDFFFIGSHASGSRVDQKQFPKRSNGLICD